LFGCKKEIDVIKTSRNLIRRKDLKQHNRYTAIIQHTIVRLNQILQKTRLASISY